MKTILAYYRGGNYFFPITGNTYPGDVVREMFENDSFKIMGHVCSLDETKNIVSDFKVPGNISEEDINNYKRKLNL